MKSLILSLITVIAFISGSAVFTSCGPETQKELSEQHDTDSHEHETIAVSVFSCPMHPEITGKMGEKCPVCKMNLVASDKEDVHNHDQINAELASCPMHPEITGANGDKCSICGMHLKLAKTSDDSGNSQL